MNTGEHKHNFKQINTVKPSSSSSTHNSTFEIQNSEFLEDAYEKDFVNENFN